MRGKVPGRRNMKQHSEPVAPFASLAQSITAPPCTGEDPAPVDALMRDANRAVMPCRADLEDVGMRANLALLTATMGGRW